MVILADELNLKPGLGKKMTPMISFNLRMLCGPKCVDGLRNLRLLTRSHHAMSVAMSVFPEEERTYMPREPSSHAL